MKNVGEKRKKRIQKVKEKRKAKKPSFATLKIKKEILQANLKELIEIEKELTQEKKDGDNRSDDPQG